MYIVIYIILIIVSIPCINNAYAEVYAPYNSPVFHEKGCASLSPNERLMTFTSIQSALKSGASPCKSCINDTSNYQSAQNTYSNNSGLKTEMITLSHDIDAFIDKTANFFGKLDKSISDRALLEKHPNFPAVEEKYNRYNALSFIEEDKDRKNDMFVEFLSTLSEIEYKVYKKWIALVTKHNEYKEEAKSLDDENPQLYKRHNSLRMRAIAGTEDGSISSIEANSYAACLKIATNKLNQLKAMVAARESSTSK